MSLRDVFLFTFMSLIARVISIALGETPSPTAVTPTAIRNDASPSADLATTTISTFTSGTAAAVSATSNGTAFAPMPQMVSNTALAAVVPVGAISITLAAVIFRMYRNRHDDDEEVEMVLEKQKPAELEAGAIQLEAGCIPIELEAREDGYGRYSPR